MELVFHQLRTEGPFLVSARLASGAVEVLFITAMGGRSEVEIIAPMGHNRALCVNGSLTSTHLRLNHDGVITGLVPRGVTLMVYSTAAGSTCGSGAGLNTTMPLAAQPGESNHYGYKPRGAI